MDWSCVLKRVMVCFVEQSTSGGMCVEILGSLVGWCGHFVTRLSGDVTMRRLLGSQEAMQRIYALLEHIILEMYDGNVIIPEVYVSYRH